MTRLLHPPELERHHRRDEFDPVVEGARYLLSSELSLRIWKRACADATDAHGRRDKVQAERRFHEIAARIAARGGRLQPDVGRLTRVGVELDGDSTLATAADELTDRAYGRETLVAAEARRWAHIDDAAMATDTAAASAPRELPSVHEVTQAIAALQHALVPTQLAAATAGDDARMLRFAGVAALRDPLLAAAMSRPSVALLFAGAAELREQLAAAASGPGGAAAQGKRGELARAAGGRATRRRGGLDQSHLALRARARRDPETVLASLSPSSGKPMADEHRVRFEQAFGRDFSHVVVHTSSDAVRAAEDLSAHAFAVGSHIYFGAGEYAPGTEAGDRLLAHELTHVVQHDDGRIPGTGVSSPSDASEQEAYGSESRIVGVLARLDDDGPLALAPAQRSPDTSRYRGAPTSAVLRDAVDGEPARRPSVSEVALMGPLPTAAVVPRARPPGPASGPASEPALGSGPAAPVPGSRSAAVPTASAVPAAQAKGPQHVPLTPTTVQAPPAAPLAPTSAAPAAAPGLGPDATAWAAEARLRGTQRTAELEAAAAAAQERIQAAAHATIAAAAARFVAARTVLESTSGAATAAVEARAAAARIEVTMRIATSRASLDEGIAARREAARAGNDAAKLEIDAIVETEATRAIAGCAERADAASALPEIDGGGDQPLVDARRDMADKVAAESRKQCERTGSDTAVEVRRAGAARRGGMDSYLVQLETSLEAAGSDAHAKLDTLATEADQAIATESTRALGDIGAHRAAGCVYLDGKQAEQAAWVEAEASRECQAIVACAPAQSAEVTAGYGMLASRYDHAAVELGQARAELGPDAAPDQLAEANQQIVVELARFWSEATAAVEPKVTTAIGSYEALAAEVEHGFASAQLDLEAEIQTASDGAIADLASAPAHFDQLAGELEGKAEQASSDGVAATLAQADAAEAQRAADTATYVQDTRGQLAGAVDQQLAWQDEQLAQSSRELAEGQARAGAEYESIKAEAEAKDSAGASTAILRGWLGNLWDWFGDLADSVLEWMQEELGKVWGTILGGILWAIIEVVGIVVCAVAWLGAQVINLVWGFIWGETAIPGYGGGFFSFIGDLIAGVLVYGDVRDVVKYWLIYPLIGEGPLWMNLLLGGLALLGLIPIFGDILKGVFKGGKALAKVGLKRLIKELGKELAERLVREVGEEIAVDLLDKLGKEALQGLASHMAGEAIEKLVKEFGETTIKKLIKEIDGHVIRAIGDDVGKEALEKLARTLGGIAVKELHEQLGAKAVVKLLDGLRGVTIKEYLDRFGAATIKKLAKDLDGYAVKELVDDLGDAALKHLTKDLEGAAIKHLSEELGGEALKKLAAKLDGTVIKKLVDDITGAEVKRLLGALGDDLFTKLVKEFDGPTIKELTEKLTADGVKEIGADALIKIGSHLSPTQIAEFARELGAHETKKLAKRYGGQAMAHYGLVFFKSWKGVTDHTINHLVSGHGIKNKKISGCHDLAEFLRQYVGSTAAVEEVFVHGQRRSGEYVEFVYSLFRKDGSGLPSSTTNTKTVVGGLVASLPAWKKKIVDSIDDTIKNLTFPTSGPNFSIDIGGVTWQGFVRDGRIDSVFPTL